MYVFDLDINGARIFQPVSWRTGKSALLYFGTPFHFKTIIKYSHTISIVHFLEFC